MSKAWKPDKKAVELDQPVRVSRIRRDPVHVKEAKAEAEKKLHWRTSEREIWLALIGIILFALAIDIIAIAVSAYTSGQNDQPWQVTVDPDRPLPPR